MKYGEAKPHIVGNSGFKYANKSLGIIELNFLGKLLTPYIRIIFNIIFSISMTRETHNQKSKLKLDKIIW